MAAITLITAFAIAGTILLLIQVIPRVRDRADTGGADLRDRILEALSDAAKREIREADYDTSTSNYFTPHEVIAAVDFIEDELNTEIPRSIYWQDTIGEIVESICTFAEEKSGT